MHEKSSAALTIDLHMASGFNLFDLIVSRVMKRVEAVAVESSLAIHIVGNIELKDAAVPVSDATDVPIAAAATGGDDIFTHFAAEYTRLVPNGGDSSDDACTFGFGLIVARGVAQHGEWTLEDGI